LAHFRQRKTKGDCAHSKKKTAKRKGSTVDAPVQEESPVATKDGGLLGGRDVCKSTCSDTPDGTRGAFVAQEHEQERELGTAELVSRHNDETDWLLQTQTVHSLELEALRLSLSNMHTAQLELTQANLQKEKETALTELREMLNSRRAQELALLQSRQQYELELIREQHAHEKEEMVLRCGQETAKLKEKLQSEMEKNAQIMETVHSLELEALRLSLSNMHTAQLELTQANLQKEKETALTELREMLNSRRAQELALLQSRQQYELELIREQHAHEKEEMVLRCGQETAKLKEKLQSEMEKNAQIMENLKQDWESERDLCLENLRKELSAKHQSEMENLQNQFQKESAEQKAELEKIFQAKNEAERENEIGEIRLENLQASYEDLKAQSQEEIMHLWSQLDSTRTNRQELNELQKQLLPRASHVEELEYVKQDFVQQSQRERTEHESELKQLRIYFEKKRDAEKTYQEDLTLLQQRLQEVKEDSLLKSEEISSSCMFSEETSEKEVKHHLDQLDLRLEQPKPLASAMRYIPRSMLGKSAAPIFRFLSSPPVSLLLAFLGVCRACALLVVLALCRPGN
ncbi:PREDICTED: pericentrin-like, partial [Galeopterus variegatus]|uniref:Pericentrin-like n=1 Tax=Galeopterus variegatus TaxID=482537 RepID=A0ABM0SJB7_GALVR